MVKDQRSLELTDRASVMTRFLSKPVIALVLFTLIFQSTNFVFDWKALAFHSRFTINEVVDAADIRTPMGMTIQTMCCGSSENWSRAPRW